MKRPKWLPFSKETITGCEGRGDAHSAYLTRYTILKFASWQLCLHHFHRSDADELHDHPWSFLTIPLGWYYDVTPKGRKLLWPFIPYFRRAEHQHRVQLVQEFSEREMWQFGVSQVEHKVWTIIVMFKRRRNWGFFTKWGYLDWKTYFYWLNC